MRIFRVAHRKLERRAWCQGAPARDADGRPLLWPEDERAASISVVGAMMLAARELRIEWVSREVDLAILALFERVPKGARDSRKNHWCNVVDWIDSFAPDTGKQRCLDLMRQMAGEEAA